MTFAFAFYVRFQRSPGHFHRAYNSAPFALVMVSVKSTKLFVNSITTPLAVPVRAYNAKWRRSEVRAIRFGFSYEKKNVTTISRYPADESPRSNFPWPEKTENGVERKAI